METTDEMLAPGLEGPSGHALETVKARLIEEGMARLPRIDGLEGPVLARWLFRRWLIEAGGWRPLAIIDPSHLPSQESTLSPAHRPAGDSDWWAAARGGWVYLGPTPPASIPAALLVEARARRLSLLVQEGGTPLTAPAGWVRELQRLDPYHAVAVDPGLAHVRRSLLAHCRAASPIHLSGEPGTGKATLARWAHAVLDDRPLSHIRGDTGRPQPGEWALFQALSELSPDRRGLLEERLREYLPRAPIYRPHRHRSRPDHPALRPIVGESAALVAVLEALMTLAPSRLPILVTGEPGAGKELVARAVHALSGRAGAFVALDMGAMPESLVESALFGHRRGAFTGAERHRAGAFRSADGGTLFLDEIGNLSPANQSRLLRVLQEGEVQPLGDDTPVRVDVRVVAATNADLDALVRRGEFRADLLGRLNGAIIDLPPLRDRIEDLDVLARHFLTQERGGPPLEPWCTPAARAALEGHHWPGNIRELFNVLRYALALAPADGPIDAVHLGPLSPHNRRRTPLITTSSHGRPEDAWGIDRPLAQIMTATTLSLPPIRDRARDSRHQAILHLLSGRPVHASAMRLLEQQSWWGNFLELEPALAALRALPPGGIDATRLEQHLPHLTAPAGLAPIRVLLSPSRGADGKVTGLTRDFSAGALLVGRVRSLEELNQAARAGDRRIAASLEALSAWCGAAEPECLELGLLHRLSRAHLLITRSGRGFRVHLMPAAGLPVLAGSIEAPDAPLRPVKTDQAIEVGTAGEIQVTGLDGRPYLRLFVFAGGIAFDEYAGQALARAESPAHTPPPTYVHTQAGIGPMPGAGPLHGTGHGAGMGSMPGLGHVPGMGSMPGPGHVTGLGPGMGPGMGSTPMPEATGPGLRVWAVDAIEEAALTEMLASFRGGMLKAHVARVLPTLQGSRYARLVDYLARAPRLSQYLVRLYEHPENSGLRERLVARLDLEPDREIRLTLLPEGLRRCLGR